MESRSRLIELFECKIGARLWFVQTFGIAGSTKEAGMIGLCLEVWSNILSSSTCSDILRLHCQIAIMLTKWLIVESLQAMGFCHRVNTGSDRRNLPSWRLIRIAGSLGPNNRQPSRKVSQCRRRILANTLRCTKPAHIRAAIQQPPRRLLPSIHPFDCRL